MDLSLFLAKAWGLFTVIITVALLIKHQNFKALISGLDSPLLILYSATLALLIGVPHILVHNIWTPDFRLLITILGWSSFIKGLLLLFFPRYALKMAKDFANSGITQVILVFYLILGLFLLAVGISY